MYRRYRFRRMQLAATGIVAVILVAPSAVATAAPAARAVASVSVNITVDQALASRQSNPTIVPNGGTKTLPKLGFVAGGVVTSVGPDPVGVHMRFELPPGLHWGADAPDPSENCVGTATVGDCRTPADLDPNQFRGDAGWIWNVVADAPGSYVLKAEILETSTPDTDPTDNSSSVTVVITGSSNGGASGVATGAVKLSPAAPRAGSVVVARVRVTSAGSPTRPTKLACSAKAGAVAIPGSARATVGTATCVLRTRKSMSGKTLRGTLTFTAGGTRIVKHFAAKLH
ncbi:MAG: hypothetical protein QOE13_3074 [Gaiellaceae bacterium]|nr:hypothetical protein [Gaiellaceae bacterium]